jgi:hypothetical protein
VRSIPAGTEVRVTLVHNAKKDRWDCVFTLEGKRRTGLFKNAEVIKPFAREGLEGRARLAKTAPSSVSDFCELEWLGE